MKKYFFAIAIAIICTISANAQNTNGKTYEKNGKTFVQTKGAKASKDEATAYTWKDTKGNEFPIFLHTYTKGEKAGRTTCYVVRKSAKTGKEYKYYIPNGEEIAKEILNEK